MPVQFFFLQHNITLSKRKELKAFIEQIFKAENKVLHQLTYVFCSDEYLLEINRSHLRHDYYTDIITFELSEISGQISGEIYISTDRVRDNAKILKVTIKEELHRVIFHGALHLCGYKDKTKADQSAMRQAEDRNLKLYFK
ncbi:MAG: rRNA maturation RNase YbeY [Bacteroidetes bacterium]|nr:rRNA maturation RNase YbeY [Bacteroidota bacterium]